MCHPDITRIIDLCGNYPDVYFTITTNGLLLTEKIINQIEQYANICVQISVDGLSKEVYEAQRGIGIFEKFKSILDQLISSKIKYLTAGNKILVDVGGLMDYISLKEEEQWLISKSLRTKKGSCKLKYK